MNFDGGGVEWHTGCGFVFRNSLGMTTGHSSSLNEHGVEGHTECAFVACNALGEYRTFQFSQQTWYWQSLFQFSQQT